jgi:outer membrane immunogenic protein
MTRFIRVGIAAATATILTTLTAQAADMRPVYKAAPPPAPIATWNGCYIGGQLGGQRGHWGGNINYPGDAFGHGPINVSRDFDGDGAFLYGAQIGCNWQPVASAFVLGVEADIAGVNKGDIGGELFRFAVPFTTDHFNTAGRFGTQASLRLKGGFAFDRVLLYVAGGVTWANLSATHSFFRDGDGSLAFATSASRNGWNIGGGLEYLFAGGFTLGVEYRYTDYGSLTNNIAAGTNGTLSWAAFTAGSNGLTTQDVRLRFNYMFGGGAPVVARY